MTRSKCYVDSVCWIAILNADDELHKRADIEYKELMNAGAHFVTSTAVLNEVANALSNHKFRDSVVKFHKRLQSSKRIEIVFIDESLWISGWNFYEKRSDKDWSLTDCISIVIMQEKGLTNSLTSDKHFEQAGFNAVLRIK